MELVNEYIYLDIKTNTTFDNSFCETNHNQDYLNLTFGINASDCLFDLIDNSYEINIRIAKHYFEKYNDFFEYNITKQPICCNTQAKVLEIINCELQGIHRKIFLESNVLFLIYQSQKNSLLFQLGCNSCSILNKIVEPEKMHQAKKFIIDNLDTNLTIPIIANNVGTNQCYLKKGFKEAFNQTIFEFIQENRMMKANHLLHTTNQNITEIAITVGYSSLSSFSQAYKNYFGISPTEQIKQIIPNN